MILDEYDIDKREGTRVPSPGQCIYCGSTEALTDEHVIPYALGADTMVFKKASCRTCAQAIQPYEQNVLSRQLGVFRAQVDAPSRTRKKNPITSVPIPFAEIDDDGRRVRDLGVREIPIEDVPLTLALWSLPEASVLSVGQDIEDDPGRPWAYCHRETANRLLRSVAEETGSHHVKMEIASVDRSSFLRFLAKTAHAFATAKLGIGSFRPLLKDIVLNRSDDLSTFVGGGLNALPQAVDPSTTTFLALGSVDGGPAAGFIAVRLQFYHQLNTPAYVVIVGEPVRDAEMANVQPDKGPRVNE